MRSMWFVLLVVIQLTTSNASCYGGVESITTWKELESVCGHLEPGVIPDSIGQLTLLKTLRLVYDQIQTLPESFGNLTQLTELYLSYNNLQTLPESFGRLTQLTELDLSFNQLQTLPESFAQLTQLTSLSLSGNQLQTLPESFAQLTRLTLLHLSYDKFQKLPEFFGNLTQLKVLDLKENQLQTLPESFGQLTQLTFLSLYRNKLQTLPESFGHLTKLTSLDLNENQLQTLPESFGHLAGLFRLDLSENQLQTLPESFGHLTQLTTLDLSENQLQTLSESFGQLTQLTELYLNLNLLTKLTQLERLMSLETLAIQNNPFTCDRASLGWFQTFGPDVQLVNSDNAQCNEKNEFEGFPLHRIRFMEDEPDTHPAWNETLCQPDSANTIIVYWTYPFSHQPSNSSTSDESYTSYDSYTVFDSYDTSSDATSYSTGSSDSHLDSLCYRMLATSVTAFDCDSIGKQRRRVNDPCFIFQVEWRLAGEASFNWTSQCTTSVPFTIRNLQPNTQYDIRVRGINVRWDISDGVLYHFPRLSAGPRAPTLSLKTKPDVPDGAPRNVRVDSNRTRERSLFLEWDRPAVLNADNIIYTVKRDGKVYRNDISDTTCLVEGLEPNSTYSFQVSARSQVGEGKFSDEFLVRTKPMCPLGSQRVENEAYLCEPCPLDTYRSEAELKECLKCPPTRPHTLASGATSISDCVEGSRFLELESSNKSVRQVKQGFWRISSMTMDFHECPRHEFCQPNSHKNRRRLGNSDQQVVADMYCTPGHSGVLCASCKDGLVLKDKGCDECTDAMKDRDFLVLMVWSVIGGLVILGPCAAIFVHSVGHESSSPGCCSCLTSCSNYAVLDAKAKENIAVVFRVFIGFFQVLVPFSGAMEFPLFFSGGLDALVNLDISRLLQSLDVGCAWETNFYHSLVLYTVFPLASLGVEFLLLGLIWPWNERRASTLGLALWLALQLLFFVYPGVSAMVFKTFRYEEFAKWPEDPFPNRTLAADYTIDFDSETGEWWRAYAGVMIAVYPIGVILLFGGMVWFEKRLEKKKSRSEVEDAVRESVAFLPKPYTWAYFECYELVRKLVLTSGFLLVQQESRGGAEIFFISNCVVFFGVVLGVRPYKSWTNNSFAVFSSFLLVVVGLFPLALKVIDGMSTSTTRHLVLGIVVAECVAFCVSILSHVLLHRRRQAERSNHVRSELDEQRSSEKPSSFETHSDEEREVKLV